METYIMLSKFGILHIMAKSPIEANQILKVMNILYYRHNLNTNIIKLSNQKYN